MNQLDEIVALLIENEKFCKIRPVSAKNDCDAVFSLRHPLESPRFKLNFSLVRTSSVTSTAKEITYDLEAGNIPRGSDLIYAHLYLETTRTYGPSKRLSFTLTDGGKILASAQFNAKGLEKPNASIIYANVHIKKSLIERCGEGAEVTGKLCAQEYHHVTQVLARSLRDTPYLITDPKDCAKFMYRAYQKLVNPKK